MTYKEELLKVFEKYSKDEIAIYLMRKHEYAIKSQDNELASTVEEMMKSLDIEAIKEQMEQPTK